MSNPSSPNSRLADPTRQAAGFDRMRQARQTEIAEDYVELIADLIADEGEARAVDLAERFGVSHATVNKTLARLAREGLVLTRPYRSIFLTDAGAEMAQHARWRHQIVLDFLTAIGVPAETAAIDAEGIEHHVSEETLAVFEKIARSTP
ncbi:MAG: manganese-binding transcriptional regulator MntR [Alphaproteobacteria bacterium]